MDGVANCNLLSGGNNQHNQKLVVPAPEPMTGAHQPRATPPLPTPDKLYGPWLHDGTPKGRKKKGNPYVTTSSIP